MSIEKQQEKLDIFDEQMNPIGTALREDVHGKGLWHQTFQCWITFERDDKTYFLLQLRHPDKESFPDKFDKACAGHVDAGESVRDGGIREFEEELGLHIDPNELLFCGIIPLEHQSSAHFIDREFCHIYLYRLPAGISLPELRLQEDEISGIFYIETDTFRKLVLPQGSLQNVKEEAVVLPGWLLNEEGNMVPAKRTATIRDFTTQSEAYHKLLFESLDQMVKR